MIARIANFANGVQLPDAAFALVRVDMNESPTINPNKLIGDGLIFSATGGF